MIRLYLQCFCEEHNPCSGFCCNFNTITWITSVELWRMDSGRMSRRDVRWLMSVEWVDTLGLCCYPPHWSHYHDHHSPIPRRQDPSQSSHPPSLSSITLTLSHPSHSISIDLHKQFSAVYTSTNKSALLSAPYPLPIRSSATHPLHHPSWS